MSNENKGQTRITREFCAECARNRKNGKKEIKEEVKEEKEEENEE